MKNVTNTTDSGFTLMEILVALLVLTTVVIAVFRLQASTLSMDAIAQFEESAPFLANRVLARIQAANEWEPSTQTGDFGENAAGYRYTYTITDAGARLDDLADSRLKRIEVTIVRDAGRQEYRVQSYRLAPPE